MSTVGTDDEQQPEDRRLPSDDVDATGLPVDVPASSDEEPDADDPQQDVEEDRGAEVEERSGESAVASSDPEDPEDLENPEDLDAGETATEASEPVPDPLDRSVPLESLEPVPGIDDAAGTGGDEQPPEESPTSPDRSFDDLVLERPSSEGDDGPAPEPATADAAATASAPPTGWRALGHAMRPRLNKSQLLAALLCGALGFALVVQVQQSAQDPLTSARQDDLVRLLDEVTQRAEQLDEEVVELTRTRDELASGSGQAQAAVDLAEQRAQSEGILSGRLPAVGPGLEIVVRDPSGSIPAAKLFNVLEELRNAGAEVVELNGIRMVTSSWFLDTAAGVTVDGQAIDSPYRWTVIGDPDTLNPALEIPGGALAQLRTDDVDARTIEHDEVEITAVREPGEPQYAKPSEPEQ